MSENDKVGVVDVLAVFGHAAVTSDTCTARVKSSGIIKPGPRDPPRWCCLKAGHEGPHRSNGGGFYPSEPFRLTDEVEFREPVQLCAKCGTRWPCAAGAEILVSLKARDAAAREAADSYLRALLHYTEGFYAAAIEAGMNAGYAANAVAHVERAARSLHALTGAQP